MSEKKPVAKRAAPKISKSKVQGYTPFPIRLLELEISAARSSPIVAMASVLHVSDILHRSALISDDAWNQVKGNTQALITESLFDTVASSLSTLVESGLDIAESPALDKGASAKILSKGALP